MRVSRRLLVVAVVCGGLLVALPWVAGAVNEGRGRPPAPPSRPPLAKPEKKVVHSVKNDVSRPLRSVEPVAPSVRHEAPENTQIPRLGPLAPAGQSPDPVVQMSAPAALMPSPLTSFEGLANGDNPFAVLPPDTNGDVGPNHYVEWVNLVFAIYSKTGTRLYGPADGSTLWSGFGGPCESANDGDPVVLYDPLANRWLFSQFALPNWPDGPFYQCLAVSTSGDPTGSYYRYAFQFSDTMMNDYPKFGVWPDGYYMSAVEFDAAFDYAGTGVVAFDRAKLIAGQPATAVSFELGSATNPMLPADLDGSAPPPAGAPNYYGELVDNAVTDQLKVWAFDVDWAAPESSTFSLSGTLTPASFSTFVDYVDQPGALLGDSLDPLSDRPMYRLAYRNLGTREAMVVNHTVDAGSGRAGIRWYELRKTSGPWSLYQQGTYAPGTEGRWMGSAAMDQSGNIAVGYSASSSSLYPSIRYAGRLAGDPLGALSQGETTLQAGTGAETHYSGRWGDYSSLSVDPVDDCTFWYANEYYATTSEAGWRTRIGSFRFPSCGPPPTIDAFDPTSGPVGTSVSITGANLNGATAVKFNGTSASFTADSAVHVTATVPAGATDGAVSVVTPRGTATSSGTFDVLLAAPAITSFSPPSGAIGASVTITGTNLNGATAVTFNGTSASFSVASPTQVTATVPAGATSGPIAVTTPGGVATSASSFTVTVPAPTVSSFSPGSGAVGTLVTVNGTNLGSATSVTFGGVATAPTIVSATQVKATVPAAAKTGKIGVTNPGGTGLSATPFKVLPKLTSFTPGTGPAGASVAIAGSGFTDVGAVKFNGVAAASFGVDSDREITAVVPATATNGVLSVVTAGGTATSASSFLAVPTISGFEPGNAAPGGAVLVDGTGFGGVSSVKVHGVWAGFTVLSKTQLRLTVPSTATDGPISVTTGGGTATSAASLLVLPRVTGFSPTAAAVGAKVTITGNAFTGATSVLFGGVLVSPTTVSATTITVLVPADAATGKLGVVTPSGSGESAATFKVVPKVGSFGPGSGPVGSSVTISGSGFTNVTAVKFNGVAASSFSADSSSQITATVPLGASTGRLSLTTAGGTAKSSSNFRVLPTISGFGPGSAAPGSPVVVDGSGFTAVSSVKVHGVGAGFVVLSSTRLRLTVPSTATDGPISVTTAGGTATSAASLFVSPRVTGFTPSATAVGATVTVIGNAFGGATSVLFGGVLAPPVAVTPTTVTVVVPADGATGKLTVVTPSGSGESASTFKVLPRLTSFAPASGAEATSVTIAGSGFTDVTAVKFNGVAASSFGVDSPGQVTAVVPATASTGRLSVVTAGGTATSPSNFLAVPTISGFTPGSAAPGSAVVVDGTGFGGVSWVKVHGVAAAFTVLSKTQLRLTVPSTATDGPISVTTGGGTATSAATLFVLPRVTSFSPSSAAVGATLTIYGSAFGGANSVLFNGVVVGPLTVSATKITVLVPADASTGRLTVVTGSGSGQSTGTFKVVPRLTSFAPGSGPAGTGVTIAGSGFTDMSAVKFNGVAASSFSVDTSSQITATVPAGATSGHLSVFTAGGTATSASSFTVTP